ncbi:MAG: Flp/Fap pilin component [Cryptosporangiaceae bacterium]|jgi:pilus assembly protein Flp/PilA|nr:Flp/Fap pilin component [Cryptosporangiaceae bacterium]MDQ1656537.1 Flp/Fap pilin component [Cryptosporangiaceae bacterium]
MLNLVVAYFAAIASRATSRASDEGATAVEYGLMIALVAAVIVVAVTALGGTLTGIFNSVTAKL